MKALKAVARHVLDIIGEINPDFEYAGTTDLEDGLIEDQTVYRGVGPSHSMKGL